MSYKGKDEKDESKNHRGVSLPNVVSEGVWKSLIDCVKRITGKIIGEEHCDFRTRRDCVDQLFFLRQVAEKACESKCKVCVAFLDLKRRITALIKKAYRMCCK